DVGSTATIAIAAITPSPTVIAATATPSSTSKVTPAPTSTSASAALTLGDKGFGTAQFGTGYAFMVTNPNASAAVTGSQYQVTIYDAGNTVLTTDSDYFPLIVGGETMGVSGQVLLPDGQTADHIDVQVKSGDTDASVAAKTDFTTENVTYVPDQYLPKVTGIVKSSFTQDFSDVRVSVVAYDDAGKIIGGGVAFIDSVPASGQAAV